MKQFPDPERLLRGFYADELRSAVRAKYQIPGRIRFRSEHQSRSMGEHPLRSILVAAASLPIITGSAMTARPAMIEARGIPLMAAAITEFAEASGLLEPFKAWSIDMDNKEEHDDA